MKYAIAGAFSTGKTTLADKLESYGFTVVKDVERKVIDILGKPQDLDAPALRNFQNRIFFEQMFNEVDNK
jgi:predicted ATPase